MACSLGWVVYCPLHSAIFDTLGADGESLCACEKTDELAAYGF